MTKGVGKDDEQKVNSSGQEETAVGGTQIDANSRAQGDKRVEGNCMNLGITLDSGQINPKISIVTDIDIEGMDYLTSVVEKSNSNLEVMGSVEAPKHL